MRRMNSNKTLLHVICLQSQEDWVVQGGGILFESSPKSNGVPLPNFQISVMIKLNFFTMYKKN